MVLFSYYLIKKKTKGISFQIKVCNIFHPREKYSKYSLSLITHLYHDNHTFKLLCRLLRVDFGS